ncbi:MAG: ATP-binding protein [Planctomycetota bacterium]
MSARLLLETAEEHQKKGLELLRQNRAGDARKNLLRAAELMFKVAEQSESPFRESRKKKAQKLLRLAKQIEQSLTEIQEISSEALVLPTSSSVCFEDIAGLEEVKEAIRLKLIYPVQYPEKATHYGLKLGGGVLLFGPPGTGKTLIAKAIAGELKRPFFAVYPSELLSKYVGEAEKNCAEIFRKAREQEGSVLFIDEVEALLPQRSAENQSPVMQRLVPQILSELDGAKTQIGSMLFLGATNEPWALDPAVLRPGRFDEKIYVGLPALSARIALFRLHLKSCPIALELDLNVLAKSTEGYSGADIRLICQKTAQKVFLESLQKEEDRPLLQSDFQEVLKQTPPSVTAEQIHRFQQYLEKMGMILSSGRNAHEA